MKKTWLITGCSGGFGRILAEAVLSRGDNAVVTARNSKNLAEFADRFPETARTAALDVTREGDAAGAVELAEQSFGRLDILTNNAGFGLFGAIEEAIPEEYRPLFETNVFGLIETTRAALPLLRRTGGGRIVNFSSGAGIVGLPGNGHYCATKFAVEGLSEALAHEVEPFGIKVIIVEPGPFRTDFLGRSNNNAKLELPEYKDTVGKARAYRASDNGKQVGDPNKAIAVILKAVDSNDSPLHLPLGERAYSLARQKVKSFTEVIDLWEKDALATGY